jgi:hypothetical protein
LKLYKTVAVTLILALAMTPSPTLHLIEVIAFKLPTKLVLFDD